MDRYKIKLSNAGIDVSFDTTDRKGVLKAWNNNGTLNVEESDGKIFSYRMSKFAIMEVNKILKDEK